jgi:UDP-N-acetylglucosamine 2-epimerase
MSEEQHPPLWEGSFLKTVLVVVGTRPEAIKLAPVIAALRREPDVRTLVCASGQHREMLDQALSLFGIVPDFDLDAMTPGQGLSTLTATLLNGLDRILDETRPDWTLAQGDTTTVLATGLASFHRRVAFGHVEAGLRTGDLSRPFPEEAYRRLADTIASAHFAPTERSRRALLAEGHSESTVILTGNTIVDALEAISNRPYDWSVGPLSTLPTGHRMVLLTTHRRESFGQPLAEICEAIRELATTFGGEGVHFVCPIHLNPQVRGPVSDALSGLSNISLIEPLDYHSMVHLMKKCELILTDSGGIQEESAVLRIPVLVLRSVTERQEGIEAGLAKLVGTDRALIVAEASRVLRDEPESSAEITRPNPYGDGRASERIVEHLLHH